MLCLMIRAERHSINPFLVPVFIVLLPQACVSVRAVGGWGMLFGGICCATH